MVLFLLRAKGRPGAKQQERERERDSERRESATAGRAPACAFLSPLPPCLGLVPAGEGKAPTIVVLASAVHRPALGFWFYFPSVFISRFRLAMSLKLDTCVFSGLRIYPGHGIRYVPCISVQSTRPVFTFLNSKSKRLFHQKKNPRKFNWTVVYRRLHKKGTVEEIAKRRVRRTAKVQRAIVGLDLEELKRRRATKPTKEQDAAKAAALAETKARRAQLKKSRGPSGPSGTAAPILKAQKAGHKGKANPTSR